MRLAGMTKAIMTMMKAASPIPAIKGFYKLPLIGEDLPFKVLRTNHDEIIVRTNNLTVGRAA
jgi:hypothetical protein